METQSARLRLLGVEKLRCEDFAEHSKALRAPIECVECKVALT
jgi:hypothetical protein